MKDLEKRVAAIEARNRKVEEDKAWETSWGRRLAITVATYVVVVSYLIMLNDSKPWLHALVPALGFVLSTLALKTVRNIWVKHRSIGS